MQNDFSYNIPCSFLPLFFRKSLSITHNDIGFISWHYRILVEDEVDWRPEGDIVISSCSYEAHQAELVTLKEVNGHSITLHERLLHRHIGRKYIFLFQSFLLKHRPSVSTDLKKINSTSLMYLFLPFSAALIL